MEIVHSWLKDYLGEKTPSKDELDDLFTYHAYEVEGIEEREGETIIDLDILPNRSSDSMCHRGVARELATLLDTDLDVDPLRGNVELPETDKISIRIADHEACPRFTASLIEGVEVKDSPEWLQTRLKALGQRPINNIVDATNYVMFALGQPMHAYDADKFPQKEGQWHIDVRFAEEEESVILLPEAGGQEDRVVELEGTELLIVDGSSNTPVGLAGIKGGRFAELNSETKNIIVEAAHFHPAIVRKTGRRLGILTDASRRFENEPSRELPSYAQKKIIDLITKIAGGECDGVVDKYLSRYEPVTVEVRVEKVNSLLGLSLTVDEVQSLIKRTGAKVERIDEDLLAATAPWERTDLNVEVDYVEEAGRIHGLSEIESIAPEARPVSEVNKRQYYSEQIRQVLIGKGFSEVITSSFLKKAKIQLQNALASDKSYVRNTIVKNINAALDANISHTDLLGLNDVRIFEIGTVFQKTETGVSEYLALSIGARTKGNGYCQKDDVVLDVALKAVEESLGTTLDWNTQKGVSELNLSEVLNGLPVPEAYEPVLEKEVITFKTISQYPAISRDVALWVGESEEADSVISTLTKSAGEMCVRQTLFDTFTKDGRTSYAFRLVFQSENRTLTDLEINAVMQNIYQTATEKNWEVR